KVTIKYDLVLNATAVFAQEEGGLYCSFEYNTDLFKLQSIQHFAASLQLILEAIAEDASQKINQLPILNQQQTQQLLYERNETAINYGTEDCCLQQLFEQQVLIAADNTAVACENHSLTYQQLNNKANQLAHYLIEQGIKPNDIIGLCFERSTEMITTMLAILKAGAAYLPLDPSYPPDRLAYMIQDSQLKLLISNKKSSVLIQGQTQLIIDEARFVETLRTYKNSNPQVKGLSSRQLAYVIYTSGSTGKPKGVMIEHKALNNLCQWHINAYEVSPNKRASHLASIGFDAAVWEVWPYLIAGAQLHVISDETRLMPQKLIHVFKQKGITHAFIPTALLEAAFTLFDAPSSLQYLLTGGEQLIRNGFSHSKTRLINHYGPTEATVVASSYTTNVSENKLPPIGKPIANIKAYVLDRNRNLVGNNVVGELYLAGVGLARGYLHQQQLTRQNFIEHRFSDGSTQRLYKTGDLVRYRHDGQLEYMGRCDQQVKIRGFRIELSEIEYCLSSLPQVKASVVVVDENSQGNKFLSAFVTVQQQKDVVEPIKTALKALLPSYMIPSFITELTQLPITENGKIDYKALKSLAKPACDLSYLPPANKKERILVEVLAKELQLDTASISMHANFFDIGGHSLILLNTVKQLNDKGIQCSIKSFYECESLREICHLQQNNKNKSSSDCLIKLNASKQQPCLFLLHPLSGRVDCFNQLAKSLEECTRVYGIQAPYLSRQNHEFYNMKQLARYYTEAIIEQQAQGPYRIGGYSIGGLIAQQISELLIAKGLEVEYFVGFDCLMEMPQKKQAFEHLQEIVAFAIGEHKLAENFFPRDIASRNLEEQIEIAAKTAIASVAHLNDFDEKQLIYGLKFGLNLLTAKIELSAQHISGKSVLFIAEEGIAKTSVTSGWSKGIRSATDVISIAGDHLHIFEGEGLNKMINKISSDSGALTKNKKQQKNNK
ncbi:MAG TPA: non-ribosomal peptide synthetase, partial [Oceanospirillales bacterium]|nr:non-ribosomal peptide synthetase [Oceanospirillales bacterium]